MKRSTGLLLTAAAAATLLTAGLVVAELTCLIGNLNDPVGEPVPGIVQGDQTFAYLVHPVEQCETSEEFVQLQKLNMWLFFGDRMTPQIFRARAGIRRAEFDPSLERFVPGDYFYESRGFDIEVLEPGPFLLEIPALNARWMHLHEFYFLTLTFETPVAADLLADGQDQPGIAYVSPDGQLWFDLFGPDKTSGGKPVIWGDVLCGADDGSAAPVPGAGSHLGQPVPNPFNPRTEISLTLDRDGPVRLTVHDAKGRLVRMLADEYCTAGKWSWKWDGRDDTGRSAPAGTYFFRAETPAGVVTQKGALVK